jgi:hypothetical protein
MFTVQVKQWTYTRGHAVQNAMRTCNLKLQPFSFIGLTEILVPPLQYDGQHKGPLGTYLIKENLSLPQNVFQLCQFEEVSFQGFSILVHFTQLVFQFLKRRLLREMDTV